jgi:hypothetical protein
MGTLTFTIKITDKEKIYLKTRWGQVNIYPEQVTGHLRDK